MVAARSRLLLRSSVSARSGNWPPLHMVGVDERVTFIDCEPNETYAVPGMSET